MDETLRQARRSNTQITDLPSCLVSDILSRLSIKTLLGCCRYVCRDWFQLCSGSSILAPKFASLGTCFLNRNVSETGKFHLGWVEEEDGVGGGSFHIQTAEFDFKFNLPNSDFVFVNSCNGLVCLKYRLVEHGTENVYVCLCNPILGEWITIPPTRLPRSRTSQTGFLDGHRVALGFSSMSNQYKLLHTFYHDSYDSYIYEIYTVGTGQWRRIGENPIMMMRCYHTFLNGSVHWPSLWNHIYVFNFDNEMFTTLPLPEIHYDGTFCLGVLRSCLWASCFDCRLGNQDPRVWVMKEYGIEESWTLMLVITRGIGDSGLSSWSDNEILVYEDRDTHEHTLLCSLDDEDEILAFDNGSFVCYDLKRRSYRRPQMFGPHRNERNCIWTAYNPSFVSLKDVAKSEQLTVSSDRAMINGTVYRHSYLLASDTHKQSRGAAAAMIDGPNVFAFSLYEWFFVCSDLMFDTIGFQV